MAHYSDLQDQIGRLALHVAAQPNDVEALLALGLMHYRAGQLEQASRIGGQLRAVAPDHPGRMWLDARLAVDRGDWALAGGLLEHVLAVPGLSGEQRAESLLLLGDVRDAQGNHDAALAAAIAGKAILRDRYSAIAASHEGETARYRRIAGWFRARALPPTDPRTLPQAPARHVFVLGFPRSGTTLLEQVLAGHPQVRTLEEAPTLIAAQRTFLDTAAGCEALIRLEPAAIAAWRARYWRDVAAMGGLRPGDDPQATVFIDKAPAGTQWLPIIARLFPEARVLFALRDPRAVVLSCLRSAFAMNALTYAFCTLEDAAQCYAASMDMAALFRARLDLPMLDVRHEAFVADPVAGLAEVAAFLGIAPDPAMLDVATTMRRRIVQTPSAPQLRDGLTGARINRWRHYEKGLQPVLPELQPWAVRLGYDAS